MLALVPLGSELERIMGSVRMFYITILLATSNAILHLLIALLVAHIPFYRLQNVMDECAIGFSGVIFSLIVIETSLSGAQSRSVFGLFNIPAKWYPLILLVLFQVLMTNVSLLGHLCGILSGFAYTYGFFNLLMPGTSFYSAIESSSLLSTCIRQPKFILCTGGNPSGYIPTYSGQNTSSSGLFSGNIWSYLSSWMPQRETSSQPTQDSRFPGRGRTLSSSQSPVHVDSNLQARLLDNSSPENRSHMILTETGDRLSDERQPALGTAVAVDRVPAGQQGAVVSDEEIQKLVLMGFDKTQVEVALAAADGDLNVAVEILSQQVHSRG
ncbi:rhomboid-like protein 15 isoform X3 [Citrus sinensis]|nr:rhomboid-like protein 15 isoform X3 [Citrus sinensis]